MNIWIVNQYADSPDRQATAHFDLAVNLVARKHRVTIFASGFNHYKRQEERTSGNSRYFIQDCRGVRFVWLKTFAYRGNDWRRGVNMLTYAWEAIRTSRRLKETPDVVIGTCPQIFGALAAYWIARREQASFSFEVRDVWPQTLVESGGLSKKSPLYWMLNYIEKLLYRNSKPILTVLPNLHLHTQRLGISKKIVSIPNGTDLSRFDQMEPLQRRPSGFTAMYLGGLAQYNGVDTILEAAKLLKAMGHQDVRFVILGDGPERQRLVQKAQSLGLDQVELRLPVPKADICKVMQQADTFIFHVNNLPVLKYGISSNKLCDYLASGRPILFAANSSNDPVAEAGAGITIPPEDPQRMAEALLNLRNLSFEERMRMGKGGAEYARKHLDTRVLALRLENALSGDNTSNQSLQSLLTQKSELTPRID